MLNVGIEPTIPHMFIPTGSRAQRRPQSASAKQPTTSSPRSRLEEARTISSRLDKALEQGMSKAGGLSIQGHGVVGSKGLRDQNEALVHAHSYVTSQLRTALRHLRDANLRIDELAAEKDSETERARGAEVSLAALRASWAQTEQMNWDAAEQVRTREAAVLAATSEKKEAMAQALKAEAALEPMRAAFEQAETRRQEAEAALEPLRAAFEQAETSRQEAEAALEPMRVALEQAETRRQEAEARAAASATAMAVDPTTLTVAGACARAPSHPRPSPPTILAPARVLLGNGERDTWARSSR